MMWFGIVTLFPAMFESITQYGITARAAKHKLITLEFANPRDFAKDKHGTVDDRPYGGGPGMVMKPDILFSALENLKLKRASHTSQKIKVIYLSPAGIKLTQNKVQALAQEQDLILISGRYEGIDQRFIDSQVTEMISIGDYVLSGGELPAMVLIDALTRLQAGALGDELSSVQDSFSHALLDHPHYTRPPMWQGHVVPEVLLSGDHKAIEKWRAQAALDLTKQYRSDLIEGLGEK